MTYGEWLRSRRDAVGMTQRELGERIGMDQSYLSKLERGYHASLPDPDQAREIAHILGTTVQDMMTSLGYYDEEPAEVGNHERFASMMFEAEQLEGVPEHLRRSIKDSIEYVKRQVGQNQVVD